MASRLICSTAYARLFVRQSGLPAEKLLAKTNLSAADLENKEFIGAEDHIALVHEVMASQADPAWAALAGKKFSAQTHGAIGFAALSAPSLGEALKTMVNYHKIRTNTFGAELRVDNAECSYSMWDLSGDEGFARVLTESTISILLSLIETILGRPPGADISISFAFTKPDYADDLEVIYGAPCCFGMSTSGFTMPADWFELASPVYDEDSYRLNLAKCKELLSRIERGEGYAMRLYNSLAASFDRRIAYFDCTEFDSISGANGLDKIPDLALLADQMHLSSRTLMRRLQAEQSSYKAVLESVRREYAENLLADANRSVTDIATVLGYEDSANFGRAFRRWHQISPGQWRLEHA